jgi:hypothetical protein
MTMIINKVFFYSKSILDKHILNIDRAKPP